MGAGWAFARLPGTRRRLDSAADRLDPLLRWLAIDGFGFHEGYFKWPRVGIKHQVPGRLKGYARRAFDQGLGRSVWFATCANGKQAAQTIAGFDESRCADLWSGVGLACAYAGGFSESDLAELCSGAEKYLCVAKLASAPEIRDFRGWPLQFVDRFSLPSSRSISVVYRGGIAAVSFAHAYGVAVRSCEDSGVCPCFLPTQLQLPLREPYR